MAIALRAAGAVQAAASGNITPALPTGWQNNDLCLLVVASLDNVSLGTPSGWTLVDVVKTNGAGFQTALYQRRLQTGDGNPTVTHTAGSGIAAFCIAYSGVSTVSTGIDVAGAWRANASSTTCTANAVTLVNPNSMLLMFAGVGSKLTLSGWSNSLTEEQDGPNTNSRPEVGSADHSESGTGSTGSRTCTVSGAGALNNGILIALRQVQTASMTKTSDGRVKAQASTTKASDGRAKVQASTTQTSDGRAKVQASTTKTADGRVKAQASTTKTADARVKAQTSTTKTSDGRIRVQASTTKASDGRVKAQASTTKTSDGRTKAQASTTKTSDARALVQASTTKTTDGRIKTIASTTKTADGRIFSPTSTSKTSNGRVVAPAGATGTSDGRVLTRASTTGSSDGRVKAPATTSESSEGRVKAQAVTTKAADGRVKAPASTFLTSDAKVVTAGSETDMTSDGRVRAQAATTKSSGGRVRSGASWTFAVDGRVFAKAALDMLSDTSVAHRGETSMASSAAVKARSAIEEPYLIVVNREVGGTVVITPVSSLQLGLSLELVVLGRHGRAYGRRSVDLGKKPGKIKLRVTSSGRPYDLADVVSAVLELRRPYAPVGIDIPGSVLNAGAGIVSVPVDAEELPEGELLGTLRLTLSGGEELIAPESAPVPLVNNQ